MLACRSTNAQPVAGATAAGAHATAAAATAATAVTAALTTVPQSLAPPSESLAPPSQPQPPQAQPLTQLSSTSVNLPIAHAIPLNSHGPLACVPAAGGMQEFSPILPSALSFSGTETSDDNALSQYELEREARIKRNKEELKRLGLLDPKKPKGTAVKRVRPTAETASSEPLRQRPKRKVTAPHAEPEVEVPLPPFSTTELAAAHAVAPAFDESLLKEGQCVAFGAIKNKATPKQWAVGSISALGHGAVHWARIPQFGYSLATESLLLPPRKMLKQDMALTGISSSHKSAPHAHTHPVAAAPPPHSTVLCASRAEGWHPTCGGGQGHGR